jgi:hypothetical protein
MVTLQLSEGSISLYLPLSPCISLYLPVSPSISLCLPLCHFISFYLPLSPSISLYLPVSPSICLYLFSLPLLGQQLLVTSYLFRCISRVCLSVCLSVCAALYLHRCDGEQSSATIICHGTYGRIYTHSHCSTIEFTSDLSK